MLLLQKYAMNN